ncbi:hypothetical protein [Cellulomonas sp. HZM]|uniref:hypothetical protein n=1 Tax=Cellulomonas sp. HZM TaxID=1454010 RepID=UPI000493276B|nr:hypothetical protein [Cellulomonas sp. HZM]
MEPLLVPQDVAAALAERSLGAVAPAGPEGAGWLASHLEHPDHYVELHVLAGDVDHDVALRLDRLRAVRHPHVAGLLDAMQIGPGRIALLVEHVPGLTLAELRPARGPFGDGEGVTLVVPVLQGIAALHDAGLVHGPVTASSVVVRPDGRPVLVDLRGAVLGTGSVEGDVRRWVATLTAMLPSPELDALAQMPVGSTLRERLEIALREPVGIDDLVRAAFDAAAPEPVRVPEPERLAAGATRAAARPPAAGRARRPQRSGAGVGRPVRRAALLAAVACVLVVGAVVVATLGRPGDAQASAGPHASSTATGTTASGGTPADDPVAAARTLTARRAEVLASGGTEPLTDVEVPGGPAFLADDALLGQLSGTRLEGVRTQVQDVELMHLAGSGTSGRGRATVRVTSSVGAHTRIGADGSRTRVAASASRVVVLELHGTRDGWRVWSVSAP